MANKLTCAGIVLAGGDSRRFGSPKAFIDWNGKSFLERSIETLTPVSDEVIVVTKKDMIAEFQNSTSHPVSFITDVEPYKGQGPLAGIYSGMKRRKADFYIISPCDMPNMKSELYVKWLKFALHHEYDCVIPVLKGKIYPLNGIYKETCLPEIHSSLLNNQNKVLDVLEQKHTYFIEVSFDEEMSFANINTKNEWATLLKNLKHDSCK